MRLTTQVHFVVRQRTLVCLLIQKQGTYLLPANRLMLAWRSISSINRCESMVTIHRFLGIIAKNLQIR